MFRVVTQYMLGFHPSYDGFEINPCIPSDWKECTMVRKFRNDIYNITLLNPDGKQTCVTSIAVDGEEIDGSYVGLKNDGKEHSVVITM